MPTLENFNGASLVADPTASLNLLLNTFGTKQQRDAEREAKEAADAEAQRIEDQRQEDLRNIDILTASDDDLSQRLAQQINQESQAQASPTQQVFQTPGINPLEEEIEVRFANEEAEANKEVERITELSPEIGGQVQAVLEGGNEAEIEEVRNIAVTGMEDAQQVSKGSNLAEKRNGLRKIAERQIANGEDPSRTIELANMDEGQLDLELQKMEVVGKDIDSVTQRAIRAEKDRAFGRLALSNPEAARVIQARNEARDDAANPGRDAKFSKAPGVVVENEDGTFSQSIPVLNDATGEIEQKIVPISGQVVSRLGETAQDIQNRAISTTAGQTQVRTDIETAAIPEQVQTRAKEENVAQRQDRQIDEGFQAIESLPNINRSLALLEDVETGGFDSAKNKLLQFTGLESGDEAELNNALGKAVLSQLKATFGAAFTAQEGQLLQDIEANFGKSTAGNKRLLERAKRSIQNRIRRAKRAARQRGDQDTLDELEALENETISPETVDEPQVDNRPPAELSDEELLSNF